MTPSTILENAGYGHEPMRDIWINPKTKKVFSRTYLEDNDEGQVMADMMDPTDDWTFYFKDKPTEPMQREILGI